MKEVASRLDVVFPLDYLECVRKYNGGCPIPNEFYVVNPETTRYTVSCLAQLLSFNSNDEENILDINLDPPEFFTKGLIAIGKDGGGDLICLDYRGIDRREDPAVVYWSHGATFEHKAVFALAESFEAFLDILQEVKDF